MNDPKRGKNSTRLSPCEMKLGAGRVSTPEITVLDSFDNAQKENGFEESRRMRNKDAIKQCNSKSTTPFKYERVVEGEAQKPRLK